MHCFDAKYDLSVEVSDSQQKCLSNLKKALRTGEYYDEDEEFDPMRCQSGEFGLGDDVIFGEALYGE